MRNALTAFLIIGIGLLLAFFIATGKPKPEKKTEKPPEPPTVTATKATLFTDAIAVKTYGIIEAKTAITISSEVGGKIIYVHPNFSAGGRIEKNTPLIKIEDSQYQSEVALAESNLAKAYELAASEKARAQQAKKEWRDLGSDSANDLFLRKPQLASANAQVKAAQIALKRAKTNLHNTQIRLPFTAYITETEANLGQFVLPGTSLAKAYDKSQLQVRLPLSQKQLSQLNLGWPIAKSELPEVALHLTMGRESLTFNAKIIHTSAQIDASSQVLYMTASLPSHAKGALPGQYVEADIFGAPPKNVYRLPKAAFHDKHFILRVKDNSLQFIDAVLLSEDKQYVYLQAKLPPNSLVVTERVPLATEGMIVKPQES